MRRSPLTGHSPVRGGIRYRYRKVTAIPVRRNLRPPRRDIRTGEDLDELESACADRGLDDNRDGRDCHLRCDLARARHRSGVSMAVGQGFHCRLADRRHDRLYRHADSTQACRADRRRWLTRELTTLVDA